MEQKHFWSSQYLRKHGIGTNCFKKSSFDKFTPIFKYIDQYIILEYTECCRAYGVFARIYIIQFLKHLEAVDVSKR